MEKDNNRRVLLSIKFGTLFKILLVVIFAIVVMSNMPKTVKLSKDTELSDENILEEENVVEVADTEPIKIELSSVTSRSLENPRTSDEIIEAEESVIEETSEEVINVAPESTPIEDVTISVDMDLNVRTGLSREDFIKLMTNLKADTSGFFEQNAGTIYDACEEYSINEIFFVGLISAESGWNIADNHRRTYNYISLMSNSGLIRFSSVEDGINQAARILHERYLTPGGSCYNGATLAGVKKRFCPVSPTWVSLVYGRMEQVI